MSRQPINEVSVMKTRAALWDAIRRLKCFTVLQLRRETCCTVSQTREYVLGLTAAGILERVEMCQGSFLLVKDTGNEAPRVRRDGTMVTMGRGREQLWQTMRALGSFTVADLRVAASTDEHPVAESEAETYCQILHKAGYLATLPATHCPKGGGVVYRLIRYTGPQPPMIQRVKSVYDPNLKEVVWSEEGGSHDAK